MAETVRERRVRLDWSQGLLASKAGLSLGTITDLEAGRPVRRTTIMLVARALGVENWEKELRGYQLYSAVQHAKKLRETREGN